MTMKVSVSEDQVRAVALQLADAVRSTTPIDALGIDPVDVESGYRIQDAGHGLHDDSFVGWKAGCTSAPAQEFLGVSDPVAGRYRSLYVLDAPASVAASEFVGAPNLEVEIGLRLLADLDAAPLDPMQLADAVEAFAAIEIVSGRLAAFPLISASQLVADNVAAGRMIVGSTLDLDAAGIRGLDVTSVELDIDGETVASGVGSDALGHPLNVLAWLAGHAAGRGTPLRAGDLVITGTCTGLVPARPGFLHVGRVGSAELSLEVR